MLSGLSGVSCEYTGSRYSCLDDMLTKKLAPLSALCKSECLTLATVLNPRGDQLIYIRMRRLGHIRRSLSGATSGSSVPSGSMDSYATTSTVSEDTSTSATEIDVDDADRQKAMGLEYDKPPRSQSPTSMTADGSESDLDDHLIDGLNLDSHGRIDSPGLRETLRQGLKGLRIESSRSGERTGTGSRIHHHSSDAHSHHHAHHPDSTHRHPHHVHHLRHHLRRSKRGDKGGDDGDVPENVLPKQHHPPSTSAIKTGKNAQQSKPVISVETGSSTKPSTSTKDEKRQGEDEGCEITDSPIDATATGDDYEITDSPVEDDGIDSIQIVDSPVDESKDQGIEITDSPTSDHGDLPDNQGAPITLMDSPSSL